MVHPYSGEAGAIGAALVARDGGSGRRAVDTSAASMRSPPSNMTTTTSTRSATGARSTASAASSTSRSRAAAAAPGARCRWRRLGARDQRTFLPQRPARRRGRDEGGESHPGGGAACESQYCRTGSKKAFSPSSRRGRRRRHGPREHIRVGLPRVLNMWSTHQFWIGFLTRWASTRATSSSLPTRPKSRAANTARAAARWTAATR